VYDKCHKVKSTCFLYDLQEIVNNSSILYTLYTFLKDVCVRACVRACVDESIAERRLQRIQWSNLNIFKLDFKMLDRFLSSCGRRISIRLRFFISIFRVFVNLNTKCLSYSQFTALWRRFYYDATRLQRFIWREEKIAVYGIVPDPKWRM